MAQQAEAGQARMLIGRGTEELAQPGRREALERRRNRARIVRPGAGGATGENLGKPNQGRQRQAVKSALATWFRNSRASTSLVAVLASVLADGRLSGSGAHLQSAADPFKPLWPPRSRHAGPPPQVRHVTIGLRKIGQRKFSDGIREHIAGAAIRSAHDKRMVLKLLNLVSSARLALGRKKSSSLGMCVHPAPFPAMSLANVARHLQPAMRYLNFSFKRVLRVADLRGCVTIDARGSRIVVVNDASQSLSQVAPHVAPCVR